MTLLRYYLCTALISSLFFLCIHYMLQCTQYTLQSQTKSFNILTVLYLLLSNDTCIFGVYRSQYGVCVQCVSVYGGCWSFAICHFCLSYFLLAFGAMCPFVYLCHVLLFLASVCLHSSPAFICLLVWSLSPALCVLLLCWSTVLVHLCLALPCGFNPSSCLSLCVGLRLCVSHCFCGSLCGFCK